MSDKLHFLPSFEAAREKIPGIATALIAAAALVVGFAAAQFAGSSGDCTALAREMVKQHQLLMDDFRDTIEETLDAVVLPTWESAARVQALVPRIEQTVTRSHEVMGKIQREC